MWMRRYVLVNHRGAPFCLPRVAGACRVATSYHITEACHFSGIIASLVCGFLLKHYAYNNLNTTAQTNVRSIIHLLASLADMTIVGNHSCLILYLKVC